MIFHKASYKVVFTSTSHRPGHPIIQFLATSVAIHIKPFFLGETRVGAGREREYDKEWKILRSLSVVQPGYVSGQVSREAVMSHCLQGVKFWSASRSSWFASSHDDPKKVKWSYSGALISHL